MPPTRFITDDSLDFVARRLRLLGYDVVTLRGGRLDEVLAAAAADGRTALTLSERRPPRRAAVPVLTLRRGDAAGSVREIAIAHQPSGPPFGRCTVCNAALQRRHGFEARGEVPGAVVRRAESLGYCPGCGRWYWEGTHTLRLREWLEAATGRALTPPG